MRSRLSCRIGTLATYLPVFDIQIPDSLAHKVYLRDQPDIIYRWFNPASTRRTLQDQSERRNPREAFPDQAYIHGHNRIPALSPHNVSICRPFRPFDDPLAQSGYVGCRQCLSRVTQHGKLFALPFEALWLVNLNPKSRCGPVEESCTKCKLQQNPSRSSEEVIRYSLIPIFLLTVILYRIVASAYASPLSRENKWHRWSSVR